MSLLQESMSEKQWQESIIAEARSFGYEMIYHTWDARHSPAGFPDLIILRGRRMIVAELKAENGQLAAEQYFWLLAFTLVPGADVYLWKPSDAEEVTWVLQNNRKREDRNV